MNHLPVEIWLQIISYLPRQEMLGLFGVNHLFFNIAMDARYKRVELQTLNRATSRYLSRLSDPAVATRVMQLTVSPDFRNYGRSKSTSMFQKVGYALQYALGRTVGTSSASYPPEDHATKLLIDVLPCLTRVNNFTIDCHSWGQHSTPEIHGFLQTAWTSFGENLRKLALRGHASAFRTIIHSITTLPLVDELFIELIDNPLQADPTCPETLLEVVAPFINDFSPRLREFTLWSWGTSEISELFAMLGHFPHLTKFSLQTSFPKTFKQDPSGLSRFLTNHSSTIEHLVLRLNTVPPAFSTMSSPLTDEPLNEWMVETFVSGSCKFRNLRELHFYPTVLQGGLNALKTCIEQSKDTIHTLVVRDRYLSTEEATSVINTLSPLHRALRLNVRSLNADLFDTLNKAVPGLKSLSLYIGIISPTFDQDMKQRSYATWNLQHIGVWHGGSTLDSPLMGIINRAIPSITTFWGHRNEIEDIGLR